MPKAVFISVHAVYQLEKWVVKLVLSSQGVNLDPFFKLLWRHVLSVGIFQFIRPVAPEVQNEGLRKWVGWLIRDDKTTEAKRMRHQRVIDFLDKYGGQQFFGDTSLRIKEIVTKFDKQVAKQTEAQSGLKAGIEGVGGMLGAKLQSQNALNQSDSSSLEIHFEDRAKYQAIVNDMHVQELNGILDLVTEVLEDCGRDIYVIIDGLDRDWADESIRFNLIRALIETAIDFRRVPRAKIVLAMRMDLIERVYRDASNQPGSQLEKVRDHCLIIHWDRVMLTSMLDRRIKKLMIDRYVPNYEVTHGDIIPQRIRKGRAKGAETLGYILDRTWNRPRDLLVFFNACIERASGHTTISNDALREAEGDYSRGRLQAIAEEWQLEYPHLDDTLKRVFAGKERRRRVGEITDEELMNWTIHRLQLNTPSSDRFKALAIRLEDGSTTFERARLELAEIFYKVAAVGIQPDEQEPQQWASNFSYALSSSEITPSSFLYLHPALCRALGISND